MTDVDNPPVDLADAPLDLRFSEVVRMQWDGDLYTTANKLEVELDLNDAQCKLLRDVLVNAIRMVMRGGVRDHEERIDDREKPTKGSKLDVTGDERYRFLSDRFCLPGGTFTTWGGATTLDHEARIGMLVQLRDGLDKTISRHQSVIAQITQSKVSCLNDLYSSSGGTT